MTPQEIVRHRYPEAKCIQSDHKEKPLFRIQVWVFGGHPRCMGRWCTTEERAWEAAAKSLVTKSLNRMDE